MTDAAADPTVPVDPSAYLASTEFLDADNPLVRDLVAKTLDGETDPKARAIKLYYAVRDQILYDPYGLDFTRDGMRASTVIKRGRGYCVTKAALLAAAARAAGIPARLGFGDVKNHLSTERLRDSMGTDVFHYHGFTELFIDGKWVKATPAFNIELCDKFGVLPLDFDGETDSVFHPYTADNRRHMEYVFDRGNRPDLPYDELVAAMTRFYPKLTDTAPAGDFHAEAAAENRKA